jgi:hypothetical protein
MTAATRPPFVDADGRPIVAWMRAGPPGRGYAIRTPLNAWPSRRPAEPDPALVRRVHALVEAIGGFGRMVRPGDRIAIKPNFNSGDPPPNSTDIPFLTAVVRLLRD